MWRDNMRLADMHIHTTFSPDGKSSMEEQCKSKLIRFVNFVAMEKINSQRI